MSLQTCIGITLVFLCSTGWAQGSKQLRSALADVVESRERCAEYVSMAKADLRGDDLREARRLYAEALARNSAWIALVKDAIREGQAKRLDRDTDYSRLSERATSAASDFTDYVKQRIAAAAKGPVRVNALPLVLPFAQMGLDVWRTYSAKKREDRMAASDAFAKDAAWKPWDAIGGL